MFHLSGYVRLRDTNNGFTGIDVRTHVLEDVADRAKFEMMAEAAKKARKLSSSNVQTRPVIEKTQASDSGCD